MTDNSPRVTGIGGVFFRARNPQETARWYETHLGIKPEEGSEGSTISSQFQWRERAEPYAPATTVWAVFPDDTQYFGLDGSDFMINYRVSDLRALLEKLRSEGVWVDDKVEEYDYGIFGWIKDPEGNRIELWQPKGEE
jgi:catechol 2,3-dioxygenase-like lactoylglutathione lyase family enzyme